MRPIDADALIETWRKRACEDCDKRKGWKNGKTVGFIYDIGEAPCRACWIDDMLDELEGAPTVGWISVKERLPEENDDVLGFIPKDEGGEIKRCNYWRGRWWNWEDGRADKVTHWMPLPEPPEVADE